MATLSVAVIGAGPAGATAARLLAAAGATVTLLESRQLPRGKACGGGLTPKAQRLVPETVLATVERRIHQVEIRGRWGTACCLDEPTAEIAMVERTRFDLALAEAASEAGADIHDGSRVDDIIEDECGVTLVSRGQRLHADLVVAADGNPSTAARHLGLGGPARRHSLALEVDLPLASAVRDDAAILSFTVPGGYAWYFPKGDHANVGVGTSRVGERGETVGGALWRALDQFAGSLGTELTGAQVQGHWIPQALRPAPISSARALLAGDAAATADPLFGEGISYAILSAMVAAQTVADLESGAIADLRPYDGRLRSLLGPAFRRLRFATAASERSMTLALTAVRLSSWVRSYAVDVIAGSRSPFAIDADLPSWPAGAEAAATA